MNLRSIALTGAAAAALVLPVVVAAPASASASIDPAALPAMSRDLGLSPQAATARVQHDQTGSLSAQSLQKALGASVIGSYLDQATGRLVVRTTDANSVAAIQAAGADAVVAKKDPRPGKAKLDTAAKAKKAPAGVTSWRVDAKSGDLVVEATDVAAAQKFVADSGASDAPVVVKQVAKAPRLYADLVGGQKIQTSGGYCSIGFSATDGSSTYVVTAGHCTAELSGTWSGQDGSTLGTSVAKNFPTDDYGTIRVTGNWTGTSQVEGTSSVLGSDVAAVGSSVCRSGATSGYHCGTIQSTDATVNYGSGDIVYGLTETDACAEPGDSGGSFISGRQAQGMTSGGSGDCTSGGTTYFQPVNEALSATGLSLVTG